MGPKRKEPPPARTLLDFFSGADTVKRARARSSQQLAPGEGNNTVSAREIIVIDSDSDDDIHGEEKGQKRVQLDSGTEVPGTDHPPNPPELSSSAHSGLFGVPSDLLGPTIPRKGDPSSHKQLTPSADIDRSKPTFGNVSCLLLERAPLRKYESNQTPLVVCENVCDTASLDNSADDTGVVFPIEEWSTGDDELADLKASRNTVEIENDGEHSDESRSCPVCSIDLTGVLVLDAETHVNQCLDMTLENEPTVVHEFIEASTQLGVTFDNDGTSTPVKGQRSDLFTMLMNSHKENEHWMEADVTASADRGSKPTRGNRRRAPFYKVLQGMPIAVDAFCYGTIPGVTAYFLTHAHSDHYTNLGSKWEGGPIYCSEETANLIIHMLAVDPRWVHPLPLNTPTVIPDTGGVSVAPIEANHCPGSCIFFFEGRQTVDAGDSTFKSPLIGSSKIFRYLHCGDFRASPCHVLHPAVNGKHIDHIYLDTTYLDPKYTFPPQPLVISACAELARRLVGRVEDNSDALINRHFTIDTWMKFSKTEQRMSHERILVIVGTYSIGKERIVKAIAQALETKVYCDARKTAILRCQADEELHALLTADPMEADVHILPLGTVTSDNLKLYLQRFKDTFSRIIGFRPTGWTYSPPSGSVSGVNASIQSIISRGQSRHFSYADLQPTQKSSYNVQIFGVPYSEHSSFLELTCFAMSCDWGRMIPTVNVGNPTSRAKMTKWFKRWESEKRCNKHSNIQPRTADYW